MPFQLFISHSVHLVVHFIRTSTDRPFYLQIVLLLLIGCWFTWKTFSFLDYHQLFCFRCLLFSFTCFGSFAIVIIKIGGWLLFMAASFLAILFFSAFLPLANNGIIFSFVCYKTSVRPFVRCFILHFYGLFFYFLNFGHCLSMFWFCFSPVQSFG